MNPPPPRIIAQATFQCYTSLENTTRPFTVSTDIKMINDSCTEQQSRLTLGTILSAAHSFELERIRCVLESSDSLSSSTINSTKTASSSSMEQTLPMTPIKISAIAHRFVSRKIFKPETCFVVGTLRPSPPPPSRLPFLFPSVSQTDHLRFGLVPLFALLTIVACELQRECRLDLQDVLQRRHATPVITQAVDHNDAEEQPTAANDQLRTA